MNIYVDDFLLALNTIKNSDKLKVALSNAYNVKDFGKIKTIVEWQITRDLIAQTIKIDQLVFI